MLHWIKNVTVGNEMKMNGVMVFDHLSKSAFGNMYCTYCEFLTVYKVYEPTYFFGESTVHSNNTSVDDFPTNFAIEVIKMYLE